MDLLWNNTIINQKLLKCVKPEGKRRGKRRDRGRNRYFLVSAICIYVLICVGAGSRQYCSRINENLTSVGFEPTTSGLDLPMLYRLSYEASTGAARVI